MCQIKLKLHFFLLRGKKSKTSKPATLHMGTARAINHGNCNFHNNYERPSLYGIAL